MKLYVSSEHDVVVADTHDEARGLLDRQRAGDNENAEPQDFLLEEFDLNHPKVVMFEGSKDFAAAPNKVVPSAFAVYDKRAIDHANNPSGGAPPPRDQGKPRSAEDDKAAFDSERERYLSDHPDERRDDEIHNDQQRVARDAAQKVA